MVQVTLTDTYVCRGQILTPGDWDVTDEQHKHLQNVGAVPKDDDAEPEAPVNRARPVDPNRQTRLASGATVNANPPGVTPGDPVQRGSVAPRPVVVSAVERDTADPSTGMPPPVVHTAEGEAVESLPEAGATQTTAAEAAPEDGADESTGDEGTAPESEAASSDTEDASSAATSTRSRPARVTSRPRSSSGTSE